jgi:ABC-type multidrug transport system fused ATPase/permease subunit
MWFVRAIGVGCSYFVVGASSTQIEHRVGAAYRQQYFESIMAQRIAYFDEKDHSTGTLTSRALGDPKSFQELLGVQGSMAYMGIFNLIGGVGTFTPTHPSPPPFLRRRRSLWLFALIVALELNQSDHQFLTNTQLLPSPTRGSSPC